MDSYYKIFPADTNHQPYNEAGNVIFGGTAMAKMDEQAAIATSLYLTSSDTADYGVTWHSDFKFFRPVGTGDVIKFSTDIKSKNGLGYNRTEIAENGLRGRTLEVEVNAHLVQKGKNKHFARARFTFVTKKSSAYADHNL